MKPRDYQLDAVNAPFRYFEKGGRGNPLIAMPTGTGKSIVIAEFIRRIYEHYPTQRVVLMTHVKELIEQNFDKLIKVWPTAPAGIFSAGLGRKDTHYKITFAGVGSFANAVEAFGHVDLLLIDECHLVSPNQETSYRQVIAELKKVNQHLKVIGLTATPYRLGQGLLTEPGGIFTDICIDMTTLDGFNWFLTMGYLSPLVPKPTSTELDLSGVAIHGGEFVQNQLQAAVDKESITYAAIEETIQRAGDRSHWMIFAAGIEHTVHVHAALDALGITATYVHSKMGKKERDANIRDYKAGRYQAMVNNGILTTGFDYPELDLITMLRPTVSPSLWVQMLGRGTRPVYAPGYNLETQEGRLAAIAAGPKQNCMVLDFAGNTRRLGPINDPVLPRKKGKRSGQLAPIKLCEECGTFNHASARFCIDCKAEFPIQTKLESFASTAALIRTKEEDLPVTEMFNVDRVIYQPHEKHDKPTSLRVSYYCGLRRFDEWVCFEHEGYPKRKAHEWWKERMRLLAKPETQPLTTLDAMQYIKELPTPKKIRVWINKKHPEILYHEF